MDRRDLFKGVFGFMLADGKFKWPLSANPMPDDEWDDDEETSDEETSSESSSSELSSSSSYVSCTHFCGPLSSTAQISETK